MVFITIITTLFNTLFTIAKTTAVVIYLNDYFKNKYPEKYEETLINISYNMVYCYSKGQILVTKSSNYVNEFINSNPKYKKMIDSVYAKKVIENEIRQIKPNKHEVIIKHFIDITEITFQPDDDCFYIFTDNINAHNTNNMCINKVVLQSQPFSTNYELSNIAFVLVEAMIGSETFPIKLKTENYNYYVVNNRIDLNFVKCYLTSNYIFDFNLDNLDKINIKVIDNNIEVKELEITNDKFIVIKKDEYIY